jgi:microcystin degradation protein MlrC
LLTAANIHPMALAVDLAKAAVADGRTPVVLADYSDRSGAATWLLQEILAQSLERTLIVTITDAKTIATLQAQGVKAGDAFDMAVGGLVDESAGEPVHIQGTVLNVGEGIEPGSGEVWINVGFGRGNVLVISPFLAQIVAPSFCRTLGLDPADFDVFAIKSRAHFRRGFDDSGFAKTILLVEPPEPFLGTVHLDALPYENVELSQFYPYGQPDFP